MRLQLERKGDLRAEPIEAALATLVEQGYLDDERFARLFVEDKRQLEQWGAERIVRGLLARGIDREPRRAARPCQPRRRRRGARPSLTVRWRCCAGASRSPPEDRRERERALGVLVRKGYEQRAGVGRAGRPRPRRLTPATGAASRAAAPVGEC